MLSQMKSQILSISSKDQKPSQQRSPNKLKKQASMFSKAKVKVEVIEEKKSEGDSTPKKKEKDRLYPSVSVVSEEFESVGVRGLQQDLKKQNSKINQYIRSNSYQTGMKKS